MISSSCLEYTILGGNIPNSTNSSYLAINRSPIVDNRSIIDHHCRNESIIDNQSLNTSSSSSSDISQPILNANNLCHEISDDSDQESESGRTPSQSHTSRYSSTRKKRRGVIEKKRRDRINNCLSELRRLVPQAFEKQGSQKLEKAEILQMTVEHLKFLQARGVDTLAYDPQRYAMDYHCMGFRDCASEVARYLSMVEGMDVQDPLRLRLISHLQCFGAQKQTLPSSPFPLMYPAAAQYSNAASNGNSFHGQPQSHNSRSGYSGGAFQSSTFHTPPHNNSYSMSNGLHVTPTKTDWAILS